MRNRLAKLPANSLIITIRGLQTQIDAFKQRQRTSGRSGVLGFSTQTGNVWDATATVGTDSDTTDVATTFTITWNGDGSQSFPMVNLSYQIFVNGTDAAHQLTPQNPSWTDSTRTASVAASPLMVSYATDSVTVTLTTLKAVTYYLKAFAVGSSPGALTVVT